jgi:hypothetical protein
MSSRRRFLNAGIAAVWSAVATSRIASGGNSSSQTGPQGAIFHRYAPALSGSIASLLAYNCAMKRMAQE